MKKVVLFLCAALICQLAYGQSTERHYLQEMQQQLASADSYFEWESILARVSSYLQFAHGRESFCNMENTEANLGFFESVFEHFVDAQELSCYIPLRTAISEWRTQLQHKLQSRRPLRLNKNEAATLKTKTHVVDVEEGPILFSAGLPAKHIALTFDDGPHGTHTQTILDTLHDFAIKATFFMVGKQVKAYPEVAKSVAAGSHSLGSHSWDHKNLSKLSTEEAIDNILYGHWFISDLYPSFPQFFDFFRPPYGALTEEQKEHVREIPLANFYWNIDSRDYAIKDPEKLLTYVLKKIEDHKERGIVLLHDIQAQTAQMLPFLLDEFVERNYTLVQFIESES